MRGEVDSVVEEALEQLEMVRMSEPNNALKTPALAPALDTGVSIIDQRGGEHTTLPRKDINNFCSNGSRGPKCLRALRICAAPSACPDQDCVVGPRKI